MRDENMFGRHKQLSARGTLFEKLRSETLGAEASRDHHAAHPLQ